MAVIALIVDVEIVPGQRDSLISRVVTHANLSLEVEPGCLRFDVLIPEDDDTRLLVYEIYVDEAALAAHRASPHMAAFWTDAGPMIQSRRRTLCQVVAP